jgi:hypothetical protein
MYLGKIVEIAVCDEPAATYERASDEHGRLVVSAATNRLALGGKIRLVPVTATRPSTSTTGASASARAELSKCGRSPPEGRFIDVRRLAMPRGSALCDFVRIRRQFYPHLSFEHRKGTVGSHSGLIPVLTGRIR